MAKSRQNTPQQNQSGGRTAVLVFLVCIILAGAGYLLFKQLNRPTVVPVPSSPVIVTSPPSLPPPPPISPPPPRPTHKDTTVIVKPVPSPVVTSKIPVVSGSGRLAIIIDDLGSSMQEARSLVGIGVPLTFSIIPGLHRYQEVASYADAKAIETMIHIPMQSKEWPKRRLEENGLLVSMDDTDIAARMKGFLRDLPHAVGANNHTGSEFTEHADKMQTALTVLHDRQLFFIDSVTTPQTVGVKVARELGMKSGRRNVFLDNEQNRAYIVGQINQAVRLAKKSGTAIAICHPHPETIRALAATLPSLKNQGVTLVPVSQLVR